MDTRHTDSYDSNNAIDPEKFSNIRQGAAGGGIQSISQKHEENVSAFPDEFPASVPYSSVQTATRPVPTAPPPPARRPFFSRIKTEYILLSKRTKIAILVGIAAVLILIIGLAAGLSTRSRHHTSNLPLPSNHGGPYTGDLTYYAPALGSCGITSTSEDNIVAVSHLLYDAVSTGSNPNANPLCGKKIRARRNDKSVDLTVVDRCTGCKAVDLDVTESVFRQLAEIEQGRVTVEWAWLEDVPGGNIPTASPSSTLSATTSTAVGNSTMSATSITSSSIIQSMTASNMTSSVVPPATTTPEPTNATSSTSIPASSPPVTGSSVSGSPATSGSEGPASSTSVTGGPGQTGAATTTGAPAPTAPA